MYDTRMLGGGWRDSAVRKVKAESCHKGTKSVKSIADNYSYLISIALPLAVCILACLASKRHPDHSPRGSPVLQGKRSDSNAFHLEQADDT